MSELFRRDGMLMVPRAGFERPADEPDSPEDLRGPDDEADQEPVAHERLTGACSRCGRGIYPSSTRCADCRAVEEHEPKVPKVWLRTGTCMTCGQSANRKSARCQRCAIIELHRTSKRAAASASRRPRPRSLVATAVACEGCGCLLRHVDELCPSCTIPWLREAARDAALATYQQHPTTTHVLGGRDETSDDRRSPRTAVEQRADPRELQGDCRLRGVA